MTQQVRKGYRNHKKGTWAAVLVVLVAAAMAVALPALGESTTPNTNGVAPMSSQEIYPSTVPVGGSNFSCGAAGTSYAAGTGLPSPMRQFQISKPTPGPYTDPATGVTFTITAPDAPLDPKSGFSFSTGNAAVVYHVGVNGGTKTEWYDYYNNAPKNAAIADRGVYGDKNLHSTPDSKYNATSSPPVYSFYTASITTFCYRVLTVAPSCTNPFTGIGFGGTAGTVQYSAQLVANGGCKDGSMVMYSYTTGSTGMYAQLSPVTSGGPNYQVVENIHWTGITGDSQQQINLRYDDTPPYNGVEDPNTAGNQGWRIMKMCQSDPRPYPNNAVDAPDGPDAGTIGDTPFVLGATAPAMPLADTAGPEANQAHTSCMLKSTFSAGTSTGPSSRVYDAWIYSLIDGGRYY